MPVCLLQRYISTRPLFIDARELALGQGAAQVTDTSSAITALRSLAALYKAIIQAVKDEAMIMEQVFLSPADALVMFVTRLFEQRVQVRDHDHTWKCVLLVGKPNEVLHVLCTMQTPTLHLTMSTTC